MEANSEQIFNIKKINVEAATVGHSRSPFGAEVAYRIVPHIPEFETKVVNATQDVPVSCQVVA